MFTVLYILFLLLCLGWVFYRLFIAKTFLLWTWKDGSIRHIWDRSE